MNKVINPPFCPATGPRNLIALELEPSSPWIINYDLEKPFFIFDKSD